MANPNRVSSPKSSDFSREIQQKRIDKGDSYSELRLLDTFPLSYRISKRESPFGVIVTVELTRKLLRDAGARGERVEFEVHLEGKFPFTPPVLICLTHITEPTISDGRDLLPHLISSPWSPSYTISSLLSELPAFVKTLQARGPRCALDLCSFPVDFPFSMKTWENHANMGMFVGKEVEAGGLEANRVMVVTETAILTLEPYQKYLNLVRLLSWGPLLSLTTIRRQRLSPSKLTLEWKLSDEPTSQVVLLKEANRCVELISRNIEKLRLIDTPQTAKTLAEDEVTQTALRKVHINDILQAIAVYESNFEEKLNAELINSLLGLYQQAIEYFSGMGDPRYDEFLDRMHCILSNDEVLAVLRSGAEDGQNTQKEQKKDIREEKKEETKREKRVDARSPLRKEIIGDLVLETPLIETLPPPPAAKSSPPTEPQSDLPSVEPTLFPPDPPSKASIPSEAPTAPPEASSVPSEAPTAPSEASSVSSEAPTAPSEASSVPSEAPSAPSEVVIAPSEPSYDAPSDPPSESVPSDANKAEDATPSS